MNKLMLETRGKPAAIAGFVVVLAACGTLATLPQLRSSIADEPVALTADVQDNQAGGGLDVMLFLHRQGFVAQPAAGAGR